MKFLMTAFATSTIIKVACVTIATTRGIAPRKALHPRKIFQLCKTFKYLAFD